MSKGCIGWGDWSGGGLGWVGMGAWRDGSPTRWIGKGVQGGSQGVGGYRGD